MVVEYNVAGRIAYITLNRPEKRNALNPEMVSLLTKAVREAELDPAVKIVVLNANGESFCAGADLAYLRQLQKFSPEENLADSENLKELFLTIYTLKKVVIAQVQGPAVAGGCGLATVCDFVFAAADAKFGYTEVKIGFIPAIVMVFLIRKIGEGRAKELLLTGTLIAAQEARLLGLVNEVVDKPGLSEAVRVFAEKLSTSASGESLERTKRMIVEVQHLKLEDALSLAAKENAEARRTEDCRKGIEAFLNKENLLW
jgi:methylglutaconyl-CoA hydratase